ncbi:MAG: Gfo/Idh/MocA family oxidoreductase [Gillisia sp.]
MITTEAIKTTQKNLSLGFIGVGWIGRNRMEVLLKDKDIKALAIAEPSEENGVEARKIAQAARITENPEDVFSNPEVDGVVIATPSAMHAMQTIEAFHAGKAVFCQKPLGRTAQEVEEVISAAKSADKFLGVDLSYRFVEAFRTVHELIQKKEIGEIYALDLVFHNAYGPDKDWFYDISKSGGGCVMDLGIHLIDMALWCLGFPEIKDISSNLYYQGDRITGYENQVEDFASVAMTSEKDTNINLQCSWNLPAGKDAVIEARFFGKNGGAAVRNVNGSFYDFTAEKYNGTQTETLVQPPDDWGGRAGVKWAEALKEGKGFDEKSADEFLQTAKVIDRIYGR